MSTIYDVARLAGVSKTTVSKVLGGKCNVRESTLERVNAAIKQLDYVPNCFAQAMRKGGTKSIAVLLPEQYNYGYMEILAGIEEQASKQGYITFVCSTGRNGQHESAYLQEAVRRKAEAIIYFSYRRNPNSIAYLERIASQVAVVVMDNVLIGERLDVVRVDGLELTRQAVEHFAKRGCKRIAYVKGSDKYDVTSERFEGYLQGLKDCGLPELPELVCEAAFTMESGFEAAKALMRQKPDVILAATDMLALGVLDYLQQQKIEVPQQVKLMGFDDIPLCRWSRPRLSTISQNQRVIGRCAVDLLLARIMRPERETAECLMNGELVLRETT